MTRTDIKEKAKDLVNNKRLNIFIPIFVVMLLQGLSTSLIIGSVFAVAFNYIISIFSYNFVLTGKRGFNDLIEDYKNVDNLVSLIKVNFIMILYQIIPFLIMLLAYLPIRIIAGNDGQSLSWIVLLFVSLVMIAAIIAMIVLYYIFFPVPYIVKDSNYNINPKDAFTLAKNMMKGKFWDIVLFQLSFIGHYLLVGITFGIYGIWFIPYYQSSCALYYINLKEEYLRNNHDSLSNIIRSEDIIDDFLNEENIFTDFTSADDILKDDDFEEEIEFIKLDDDDIIPPED